MSAKDCEVREMDSHDCGGLEKMQTHEEMEKCEALYDGEICIVGEDVDCIEHSNSVRETVVVRSGDTSKMLLIGVYMLVTAFTGCVYWGWSNGFRNMLEDCGAYKWLCGKNQSDCPARESAIGELLSVAVSGHMFFSCLAGIMLDYLGPRYTGVIGCVIKTVGWLLIGCSSETFVAYIPGFLCLGASTDMTYLPILDSATILLPHLVGTIVALLGSAMSTSSLMPVILYQIHKTLTNKSLFYVCLGYIIFAIGTYLIVAFLLVPQNRTMTNKNATKAHIDASSFTSQSSASSVENKPTQKDKHFTQQETQKNNTQTNNTQNNNIKRNNIKQNNIQQNNIQQNNIQQNNIKQNNMQQFCDKHFATLVPALSNPSYFLIIPFGCSILLLNQFMAQMSLRILGPQMDDIWGWIRTVSFLGCLSFGCVTDAFGIFWALFCLVFSGSMTYIFAFGVTTATRIFVIIFFFFYSSWCSSSLFTYITATQPREHFGKMAGLVFMVAGATQLAGIPVFRWATMGDAKAQSFCLMLGLAAMSMGILAFLFVRARRAERNPTNGAEIC